MNCQAAFRFSLLALFLTLTLAKNSWVGAPIFRVTDAVQSRHPRDTYRHFPCYFLSQLTNAKDMFIQIMDHNDDGRATYQEVKAFLTKIKPQVTDDVVTSFIRRRDTDGSGAIELIPEYVKLHAEGDYGTEAAREWFPLHDLNEDGLVSKSEITHLAEVVAGMSPEAAEEVAVTSYLPLDQDGDGALNFQEFSVLYQPYQGA